MFLFSPFSYLGNDPSWFNHSCKSEGTPPMPSPPRHKALSRVDYPPSSPTRAILRLYFLGGGEGGIGGYPGYPLLPMNHQPVFAIFCIVPSITF